MGFLNLNCRLQKHPTVISTYWFTSLHSWGSLKGCFLVLNCFINCQTQLLDSLVSTPLCSFKYFLPSLYCKSTTTIQIGTMAESSGEAKVYLRLVIDEEKNKVVLAEAGKDFVDVLFSFLTLPMGTIARLFKKHNNKAHPPVSVGCFNNLYTSVVDIGVDNFQTEACKRMLLCPRSVSDVQCQRLKVNINPTEREKYFNCPLFSRCRLCSNFSTTRCQCGNMMKEEIRESQLKVEDSKQHGVFVSGGDSTTFIITDDLEVSVKSTGLVLERLKSLGCADVSKLGEKFVGIGPKEVLINLITSFYISPCLFIYLFCFTYLTVLSLIMHLPGPDFAAVCILLKCSLDGDFLEQGKRTTRFDTVL